MIPEKLTRPRKGKKANSAGEQTNNGNEGKNGGKKREGSEIH